jgi:cytochrome c5
MKLSALSKCGLVMILTGLLASQTFAMSEEKKKAIADRIKPVGEVCLQGDSKCASAATASAGGGAKSGEEIFNSTCTGCHSTGAAGAPKVGDKAAWAPRIAQGIDKLHDHALNGLNAMPPKGMCATCSDDEIKATVDFMVGKSK